MIIKKIGFVICYERKEGDSFEGRYADGVDYYSNLFLAKKAIKRYWDYNFTTSEKRTSHVFLAKKEIWINDGDKEEEVTNDYNEVYELEPHGILYGNDCIDIYNEYNKDFVLDEKKIYHRRWR